jgi:hypothetical protein
MAQQPQSEPSTLVARLAKLLEDFTMRQKPETQAAIAKALGVVNAWRSRLQKK